MARAVELRPLTDSQAQEIAQWHYEGPFEVYDWNGNTHLDQLQDFVGAHMTIEGQERLVGFVVFGQEARIPGLQERPNVTDLGVGVHPQLLGHGIGVALAEAAVRYAYEVRGAKHLRASVQTWNLRSQALCFRMGFHVDTQHTVVDSDGQQVQYDIFMK